MRAHTYAYPMVALLRRAFALSILAVFSILVACATLREAESPAVRLGACVASALVPIAGTYERAEAASRDLLAKRVYVEDLLQDAHATAEESAAAYSALRACADEFKAATDPATGDAGAAP